MTKSPAPDRSDTRRKGLLRRFATGRRGSATIAFGLGGLAIVGGLGLAVDYANIRTWRTALLTAGDAAVLAVVHDMDDKLLPELEADAERFVRGNLPPSFLDSLGANDLEVKVSLDAPEVKATVRVTAKVDTLMLDWLGSADSATLVSSSVGHKEVRGLELSLVMDNTGSMNSGGKMDAMKAAAFDLLQLVYREETSIDTLWVGVVPFVASVNAGGDKTSWLAGYNSGDFGSAGWKGCMEARPAPYDQDDTPPDEQPFAPYLWSSTSDQFQDVRRWGYYGDNDWPPVSELAGSPSNAKGPNIGCPTPIQPLTHQRAQVESAITQMQPWFRGGTIASNGLSWGWRVLSPRWKGLWGDPQGPLNYGEALYDKTVVLLTDGENYVSDGYGLPGSPLSFWYPGTDYTAYGRITEERLGPGINTRNEAVTEINSRLANTCELIKAQGIKLYTITFQTSSSLYPLYEACATSPRHFFPVVSNDELKRVFRKIASQLSNIRIVK
ncbi:hypothetical protein ACTL6U_06185 [Rhodovibrionaceae bacterium A322]